MSTINTDDLKVALQNNLSIHLYTDYNEDNDIVLVVELRYAGEYVSTDNYKLRNQFNNNDKDVSI